jgi:amino acid adenylation domain-containing protein
LFETATIERLAAHFQSLLAGIVRAPEQRLSLLPLLTEAERSVVLTEWSGETREFARDRCVHELFAEQAARTPDAVAVVYEDQQLTYRELNDRANQLAHYLQTLGVGPDSLVGICVERSIEMMVGLLGVMKAGGAYVPLDPQYPVDRLAFMLADAGVAVLLTQQHLTRKQASDADRTAAERVHLPQQVVYLDSSWALISTGSSDNPVARVSPANLAYVIYTSGSTGRPKGVMVSHAALLNFLTDMQQCPGLQAADTLLSVTTLSFDIAGLELFLPLIAGARVVIAGGEATADPTALMTLLAEHAVTVMQATPATWRMLIEAGWEGADELRVLCGGEALSVALADQLAVRGGEVWNLYGPTETTIWSARWPVKKQPLATHIQSVLIGKPIANTQCYVLDAEMGLAPVGVSGELYIGGDGLARGYFKRPELTAERFVPDPHSTTPGARLYRTGDVVRWRDEGDLEYVRRADQQVKLRGFRIELGEIEAALGEHETVGQSVVVLRDESGDKRLVAYVVPANSTRAAEVDAGLALTAKSAGPATENDEWSANDARPAKAANVREGAAAEWRQHLRERLPEYMVPAAFVVLDHMPLTPNGKVDRKRLPAPELDRQQLEKQYVGPRTVIEDVVAGIWQEALALERVGVHDNFFELGGHSLLATRLISRIRLAFNVELPLRTLFEFPTVAGFAACVESERPAERLVLGPPLRRVERDQELPLSFAQQRLWFLDQLEPESAAYNMPAAVRLSGRLEPVVLGEALNEVVRRHEVLRTSFVNVDGKPVQLIAPSLDLPFAVVDLSSLPATEREREVLRLVREEAQRPFKLNTGPLLRAGLLRLGDDEHVLLVTMHHIISDGWSLRVLVKEVATLYEAFAAGQSSPLPELAIQYADYAVWQQTWLSGEVLDQQLDYWQQQLAGAEILELPTDHERPPVQSYAGAHYDFAIAPEVATGLSRWSQREGVTLFMTLLAAFQALLHRYTGQDDISIGTPVAGRTRLETEALIGFFVNTLVLRAELKPTDTFSDLLRQVRETTLEAHAHQDVPFEKLVEELQPERDLSRTPLFQVMFTLQNHTPSTINLENLSVRSLPIENTTAKFDLSLELQETQEGLSASFEYSTDLFEAATIERLAAHFQTLLAGIVRAPEQRLSRLPLLTEAERSVVLTEWSGETREFARDRCVHELFAEQAAHTPDAVAVVYEDQQLTYRELNDRANQLAHYLQRQGVGPDTPVGIMVDRSIEMVVGLFGILKAGGAYVPLDPQYPVDRLAFMLDDSGVDLMLTQQSLLDALPQHNMQVVLLDSDWEAITTHQTSTQPPHEPLTEHLAYIIYTSGSTGKPKGVMIEHRSLTNYIQSAAERFALQPGDRLLQFFSLSFDAIAEELYSCLTRGATLVLRTAEMMATPFTFVQECARHGITVLDLPVAYWHELTANQRAEDWAALDALRLVAIGGEEALPERFAQWHRAVDHRVRLINTYGPTEATIIATMYELSRNAEAVADRRIPIGRAVDNVKTYVLDKHSQPVPTGVLGELYLGGLALARGYFNDPGFTADRFVPDPFSNEPGARLYKTGDLVRYLPDGNIEFRGRNDHQVKVRGFRVELGEVESAIVEHPLVHDAVVMARDEHGGKMLVAYVVPAANDQLTTGDLRNFLRQALPHYMLPAHFIVLDALPLLPNGKLDRRALPAPDHSRPELAADYVAPRDDVEQRVVAIWEEVLGIEGVGVHDNFFDLGGHSLLATQIVSRLRSAFHAELPLRRLFETPTVEGLALAVTSSADGDAATPFGAIERTSRGAEEVLLDKLDQLSDEEVELLLQGTLAGEQVSDEQQF